MSAKSCLDFASRFRKQRSQRRQEEFNLRVFGPRNHRVSQQQKPFEFQDFIRELIETKSLTRVLDSFEMDTSLSEPLHEAYQMDTELDAPQMEAELEAELEAQQMEAELETELEAQHMEAELEAESKNSPILYLQFVVDNQTVLTPNAKISSPRRQARFFAPYYIPRR